VVEGIIIIEMVGDKTTDRTIDKTIEGTKKIIKANRVDHLVVVEEVTSAVMMDTEVAVGMEARNMIKPLQRTNQGLPQKHSTKMLLQSGAIIAMVLAILLKIAISQRKKGKIIASPVNPLIWLLPSHMLIRSIRKLRTKGNSLQVKRKPLAHMTIV
jgi:hypothetical protein